MGTAGNNVDCYSLAVILLHPCNNCINSKREKNCHNKKMHSLLQNFFLEMCLFK